MRRDTEAPRELQPADFAECERSHVPVQPPKVSYRHGILLEYDQSWNALDAAASPSPQREIAQVVARAMQDWQRSDFWSREGLDPESDSALPLGLSPKYALSFATPSGELSAVAEETCRALGDAMAQGSAELASATGSAHYALQTRLAGQRDALLLRHPEQDFDEERVRRELLHLRSLVREEEFRGLLDTLHPASPTLLRPPGEERARLRRLVVKVSTGRQSSDDEHVSLLLLLNDGHMMEWRLQDHRIAPAQREQHTLFKTYCTNTFTLALPAGSSLSLGGLHQIGLHYSRGEGEGWDLQGFEAWACVEGRDGPSMHCLCALSELDYAFHGDGQWWTRVDVPAATVDPALEQAEWQRRLRLHRLIEHLSLHRSYYNARLWLLESPNARAIWLDRYRFDWAGRSGRLLDFVENRALGVFGDSIVLPLIAAEGARDALPHIASETLLSLRGAARDESVQEVHRVHREPGSVLAAGEFAAALSRGLQRGWLRSEEARALYRRRLESEIEGGSASRKKGVEEEDASASPLTPARYLIDEGGGVRSITLATSELTGAIERVFDFFLRLDSKLAMSRAAEYLALFSQDDPRARRFFTKLRYTDDEGRERSLSVHDEWRTRYASHWLRLGHSSSVFLPQLRLLETLPRAEQMPLLAAFLLGLRELGPAFYRGEDVPTTFGRDSLAPLGAENHQNDLRTRGLLNTRFVRGSLYGERDPLSGDPIEDAAIAGNQLLLAYGARLGFALQRFREIASTGVGFALVEVETLPALQRNFWLALSVAAAPGRWEGDEGFRYQRGVEKGLGAQALLEFMRQHNLRLHEVLRIHQFEDPSPPRGVRPQHFRYPRIRNAAHFAALLTALEDLFAYQMVDEENETP